MKSLEQWLLKQAKAEARRPRLMDALLGHTSLLYVAHRLRFVTLRVLLRTVLHLLEIAAIARVFPMEYLGPILLLRHSSTLLQSLWWGALEPQRDALRDAHHRRELGTYAKLSSQWSALSLVAIGITFVIFGSWLALAPRPFQGFSIYDAYAIACGLRAATEIWSRTQHSAVFAVARIRRPLISLVLVDLFEVFGLLVAWLKLGPFAFALMLALTGFLRAGFTLWFTRVSRRNLELPPRPRSAWAELRRTNFKEFPYRRSLIYALGNAALQLDSIAIVLLSASSTSFETQRLTIALHALAPLFGAGYGWSRVFYFDFKSLLSFHSPLLTRRFGRLLDRVALTYPIVLALLAWPLVTWLFPITLDPDLWMIGLFILSRSALALRQVEAYSFSNFRVQIRQALVLLVGLATLFALRLEGNLLLVLVSIVILIAAFGGRRASNIRSSFEPGTALSLEAWLEKVLLQTETVRLLSVTIDRKSARMGIIRSALIERGFVSPILQVGKSTWVMTVPSNAEDALAIRKRLILATAGAATRIEVGLPYATGHALLHSGLIETQQLTWLLGKRSYESELELSHVSLITSFQQLFPEGICLTERSGRLRSSSLSQRRLFAKVLGGVSELGRTTPQKSPQLQMAVYRPRGEPQVAFVLPTKDPTDSAFGQFRLRVEQASLRATLASLFERV